MNPKKLNPRNRNEIMWMNRHLQRDLDGAMLLDSEGTLKIFNAVKVVKKLDLDVFHLSPRELVDKLVEYLNKKFPGQNFMCHENRR